MSDRYTYARQRTAKILRDWSAGTITLKRVTRAAPEVATPWVPGEADTAVYTLDARADGVTADQIDGTTVLATDVKVIVSPKARLSGAEVDVVPVITDLLTIGGVDRVIKKIEAVPASGAAARFHLYVAA